MAYWMKLAWEEKEDGIRYWEAVSPVARFCLQLYPTNNIRGPWCLLIERTNTFILPENRYYHDLENAKEEADLINQAVLRAET